MAIALTAPRSAEIYPDPESGGWIAILPEGTKIYAPNPALIEDLLDQRENAERVRHRRSRSRYGYLTRKMRRRARG